MDATFDPYYKWLGIPPEEQPPNHYRLLGVSQFESNEDVIANAADQRMAYLRGFQSGKQSEACQKLLNEISAARLVLLNAAKKANYDSGLKPSNTNGTAAGHGGGAVQPAPAIPMRQEISAVCPCGAKFSYPAAMQGKKIPCPKCGNALPPARPSTAKAPADPLAAALDDAHLFETGFDEHKAPSLAPQYSAPPSGPPIGMILGIGGAVLALCMLCCVGGGAYLIFGSSTPSRASQGPPPRPTQPRRRPPPQFGPPSNRPTINSRPMTAQENLRTVTGEVDLISLVDPQKDTLRGEWRVENGDLICRTMHLVPRLLTPYLPPEEFDVHLEFSQDRVRNPIGVCFPQNGGYYVATVSGFKQQPRVTPGEKHAARFEVRTGKLTVYYDGEMLREVTDLTPLKVSHWHETPDHRRLAVFCDDPTTFYDLRVTPVSGTAQTIR